MTLVEHPAFHSSYFRDDLTGFMKNDWRITQKGTDTSILFLKQSIPNLSNNEGGGDDDDDVSIETE